MAESGEAGIGRMAEPLEIVAAVEGLHRRAVPRTRLLAGKRVLVTSGPTHEPIDPVRYIANRSSGKQGHAIAAAAASAGADVTLISGPVQRARSRGVRIDQGRNRARHAGAVEKALPADVAVFAAAVADWRRRQASGQKIKKDKSGAPAIRAGGESRHPRDRRAPQAEAARDW